MSLFEPQKGQSLVLEDLVGWEQGVQGDLGGFSGAYFEGKTLPVIGNTVYTGVSVGATTGVVPTWGSASGYVYYGGFLYNSKNH